MGAITLPHRPRGLSPDLVSGPAAQQGLATLRMALDTEAVYDSVDALARALSLQQTSYTPWRRRDPAFKPVVSGLLWTPSGPRKVYLAGHGRHALFHWHGAHDHPGTPTRV